VALAVAVAAPASAFEVDTRAVAATVTAFKSKQPLASRLFASAWGYAIYPTVTRGAWGVGGAYAEGGLYRQGTRANAVFLDKGVSGEPPWVDGVLVLAQTKGGLMADASVGGQRFTVELASDP